MAYLLGIGTRNVRLGWTRLAQEREPLASKDPFTNEPIISDPFPYEQNKREHNPDLDESVVFIELFLLRI
jgi:hypothetical protein